MHADDIVALVIEDCFERGYGVLVVIGYDDPQRARKAVERPVTRAWTRVAARSITTEPSIHCGRFYASVGGCLSLFALQRQRSFGGEREPAADDAVEHPDAGGEPQDEGERDTDHGEEKDPADGEPEQREPESADLPGE